MSLISSSNLNASLPFSLSSPINMFFAMYSCFNYTAGTATISAFTITNILIFFPLSFLILYLGLQRWRQQHTSATISHSDLFTYHLAIADLMSIVEFTLICCGVYTDLPQMIILGLFFNSIILFGQMFFHVLTCVERYLAVVHPITYLSLRKEKWIRIRNITVGCVWLLCFVVTGLVSMADNIGMLIFFFCVLVLTIIVVSFCSLSVLCVLIRPGPGEEGGVRPRVDQSKLRAFYTIMTILGVLLVRFVGNMLGVSVYASPHLGEREKCAVWFSVYWFSLPSSLVLPLLFLQKAGKLLCCKTNNKSGQDSD